MSVSLSIYVRNPFIRLRHNDVVRLVDSPGGINDIFSPVLSTPISPGNAIGLSRLIRYMSSNGLHVWDEANRSRTGADTNTALLWWR